MGKKMHYKKASPYPDDISFFFFFFLQMSGKRSKHLTIFKSALFSHSAHSFFSASFFFRNFLHLQHIRAAEQQGSTGTHLQTIQHEIFSNSLNNIYLTISLRKTVDVSHKSPFQRITLRVYEARSIYSTIQCFRFSASTANNRKA